MGEKSVFICCKADTARAIINLQKDNREAQMKKLTSILIIISVILSLTSCQLLEDKTSNYKFRLNEDGESYMVYDVKDKSIKEATVPTTYNGKPVTVIAQRLFMDCEQLVSVTIPEGIEFISLLAFESCDSLERVYIPASVSKIEENAFFNCRSLKEITVEDNNKAYKSDGGVLYDTKSNILLCYPANRDGDRYEVLFGTKRIGEGAFSNAKKLKEVILPHGLEEIGICAFSFATVLEYAEIPDTVTYIDSNAFNACTSLSVITLPKGITKICEGVFAFCTNLGIISIPNGVTEIRFGAFDDCNKLQIVEIPDTVTDLGYANFGGLEWLDTIYYWGSEAQWKSLNGVEDIDENVTVLYNTKIPSNK